MEERARLESIAEPPYGGDDGSGGAGGPGSGGSGSGGVGGGGSGGSTIPNPTTPPPPTPGGAGGEWGPGGFPTRPPVPPDGGDVIVPGVPNYGGQIVTVCNANGSACWMETIPNAGPISPPHEFPNEPRWWGGTAG